MEVVVGRIGRAHGIRGDVGVEVRTDEPERRFVAGAVLRTEPEAAGPLTVTRARRHGGRLLVTFDEVSDRAAAEALRGVALLVDVDLGERPEDPEEYYDRHLVGLAVHDRKGRALGRVDEVVHLPAQDLLAVTVHDGRQVLVPFVAAIVPTVDVAAGRLVVDAPPGLLDDDED